MKLSDVSLPDAQGEDLHPTPAQHRCYWPRIPTVRVAVRDEEDDLRRILTRVPQNLLRKCAQINIGSRTKNNTKHCENNLALLIFMYDVVHRFLLHSLPASLIVA